jgi:hypothetical protein
MALVDEIENFGRAVDDGTLTRAEAASALVQASAGSLTEVGAGIAIDSWKTARATYDAEFKKAGVLWARCNGIDV